MECNHSYNAYVVAEAGIIELQWVEGQEETLISRDVLTSLVRDANAFRKM